jgi:transposase InsO family protein
VKIPPRSPSLNAICERFLGSVRRECLDHVVILGERHLQWVLKEYIDTYFNPARPHQGLSQRVPAAIASRASLRDEGRVIALPILGGLHHDYRLAA